MAPGTARAVSLLSYGGGITLPVLAAGLMGVLVWKRGRDEQYAGLTPGLTPVTGAPAEVVRGPKPVVAVQFAPPAGVAPGLVGTVLDEEANTIDVSATVVDLAVRGYLRIEEVSSGGLFKRTDWRLTRLTTAAGRGAAAQYEQTILEGLFATGQPGAAVRAEEPLRQHPAPRPRPRCTPRSPDRGWFRESPEQQRRVWRAIGTGLVVVGLASGWFLGFRSVGTDQVGGVSLGVPSGIVLAAGLVVAGLVVRLLGKRMAARTADGSAVLAQSLGFKQYLVTAEAGQIRFEEAQDIFSRYLPYAIVFGVADRWARVVQRGGRGRRGGGAVAGRAHLVRVLRRWLRRLPRHRQRHGQLLHHRRPGTFTSTPGSSGGSGFSGGGFSGGGGGGGGSSSW